MIILYDTSCNNSGAKESYWLLAKRDENDGKFYYGTDNQKEDLVDTENATLYDGLAEKSCLTIEREDLDNTKLALRSAGCKSRTAIAVCIIKLEEEKDEAAADSTEGEITNEETPSSSNIPGTNLPKFPCISQSRRKKREGSAVGSSNEVKTEVEKEYELEGNMILRSIQTQIDKNLCEIRGCISISHHFRNKNSSEDLEAQNRP